MGPYEFDQMKDGIQTTLEQFVARCDVMKAAGQDFVDPDTTFLHDKISHALRHQPRGFVGVTGLLIPIIGELALKYGDTQDRIPPNRGNKTDWLRLSLWLVRGRRDDEIPFATESDPKVSLPHAPFNHIADLTKQTAKNKSMHCAHCNSKTEGKPKHCTGCLVDEKWAFLGMAYCSKKCQVDHWKEYKSVCKHRKSLFVAVTQLRALTQLFQYRTCDQSFVIEEARGAPHRAILMRPVLHAPTPSVGFEIDPRALRGDFVFRELPRVFPGPHAGDTEDYDNAIIHHSRCEEHCDIE